MGGGQSIKESTIIRNVQVRIERVFSTASRSRQLHVHLGSVRDILFRRKTFGNCGGRPTLAHGGGSYGHLALHLAKNKLMALFDNITSVLVLHNYHRCWSRTAEQKRMILSSMSVCPASAPTGLVKFARARAGLPPCRSPRIVSIETTSRLCHIELSPSPSINFMTQAACDALAKHR